MPLPPRGRTTRGGRPPATDRLGSSGGLFRPRNPEKQPNRNHAMLAMAVAEQSCGQFRRERENAATVRTGRPASQDCALVSSEISRLHSDDAAERATQRVDRPPADQATKLVSQQTGDAAKMACDRRRTAPNDPDAAQSAPQPVCKRFRCRFSIPIASVFIDAAAANFG